MADRIRAKVYVLGDNIDTDQIIPARYLNLVPTIPDEYVKLGSYALSGLPASYPPFVAPGVATTCYPLIVAGRNFGCGSSREHAPVSLGAAGVKAVIAESFARIFFRNCMATGELFPVESTQRLCDTLKTGDEIELDLDANQVVVLPANTRFATVPLGAAREVIEKGGLFAFAREHGMMT